MSTLSYVDPAGALDPRLWSLGADGLVVTWDTSTWTPLAWRRFDEARAIGGLYEGDVVVETPSGVLRVQPGSLIDSSAAAAYPGAVLPSPAGLLERATTHIVVPPARSPSAVVPISDGIALLEAAAWCTVTTEPALRVRCFGDPSQRVLAALGDTVMVCSQRGDEASVRIRSLRSGDTVAEQPAPRCPDSAIGTSNAVTAAAGGSVFDWNGELLSNHEVQGVLSATTPVGWSRERLALVERFDGTCASSRRVLLRSGDFGEETIWRGECDGDERLIPVSFTTTRGDGAAVVRPAGDGVFVEIFHRNGQRAGRLTLDNLPSATARLAGDGENLRIVDPAASASERVDVGTSGTATFVREGPVLWVERDGLPIGSLVVLGEEAVVTAPGSIVATDGVAGRVALPTDGGPVLLPNAGLSPRGAEQLLRGLAAATQR